jgi:hypothetical protein
LPAGPEPVALVLGRADEQFEDDDDDEDAYDAIPAWSFIPVYAPLCYLAGLTR